MSVPAALKDMTDIDSGGAIAGQIALLNSRRTAREGRENILRQRILQVEEEILGLGEMIDAQLRQLELLKKEIVGVQKLLDSGLERLPRVLALQRAMAQIEVDKAANRARVARDHQEIGETRMQMIAMRDQDNERINEDLTKVRGDLAELRSELVSREDILARTHIIAPISGTVMNVRITTETGVIKPGDSILDIVPKEARLIIDAHVKPTDIDNVHPGMKSRVLLTAYRQRNLPQIHGVLKSVSADILFDDSAKTSYFLAKVDVEPEALEKLEDVRLVPGMPAEVMILNHEQTFFQLMIAPLSVSLTKSFREN
jgi:HlyD family secretion protein